MIYWYYFLQEQLRHKRKFNVVSFDSLVKSWQPGLVNVNESNLQSAWRWINDLTCHATTNTLEALQLAFKDTENKAIYLLTDGRPDHVRTITLYCYCVLTKCSTRDRGFSLSKYV